MAGESFKCSVVTPEKQILDDQVTYASIPAWDGQSGIAPGRAALLVRLGIGTMLSGALFAEIVFSRPGIGKLLHEAVMTRNYPVVMGSVLVTTVFFVASTLASDVINALLDPRLRSARSGQ